jgi:hypothetical protein
VRERDAGDDRQHLVGDLPEELPANPACDLASEAGLARNVVVGDLRFQLGLRVRLATAGLRLADAQGSLTARAASVAIVSSCLGQAESGLSSRGVGLWQVVPVPALAGYTVEWSGPGDYILSRRESLYATGQPVPPFGEVARFPLPPRLRLGSRLDFVRRALRLSYYNVLRLPGQRLFVTFNRSAAVVAKDRLRFVAGLERPFRVLRNGCAVGPDGSVWFGEYLIEPEDSALRIYRLPPGSEQAEAVHVFPAGYARHIHGIYADPLDRSLWCLTGDHHDQAKIMRSPDGVEPFTIVGSGDESWRAVSMLFRADAVYYATDAQHRQNWIYRVDRETGARTEVAPIDGPVYYSHQVGDDLFFAVTAELSPIQETRSATLWHLDASDHCTPLATFTKDRWPVAQFLPGTLSFPRGPGNGDGFYFSAVALAGVGRTTFRCEPATS